MNDTKSFLERTTIEDATVADKQYMTVAPKLNSQEKIEGRALLATSLE